MTVTADDGGKHLIKKCFYYTRGKDIPITDCISDIKLSALISHPKLT